MPYVKKTRFYQEVTSQPRESKFGFKPSYKQPPKLTWAEKIAKKYDGVWFDYTWCGFWDDEPSKEKVKLVASGTTLELITERGDYQRGFHNEIDFYVVFGTNLTKFSIIKNRLINTIHR